MYELNNIGKLRKCNLWINEALGIEYSEKHKINTEINKNYWIKWNNASYTIEIFTRGRHSDFYALLGFNYVYKDIDNLIIEVKVGNEKNEVYSESLANKVDDVYLGISEEYAKHILEVATNVLKYSNCSTGIISFDVGAYGYIGSSENMFEKLTLILLEILKENDQKNIEKMEKIILNTFEKNVSDSE